MAEHTITTPGGCSVNALKVEKIPEKETENFTE
jgi:hypothetical protein